MAHPRPQTPQGESVAMPETPLLILLSVALNMRSMATCSVRYSKSKVRAQKHPREVVKNIYHSKHFSTGTLHRCGHCLHMEHPVLACRRENRNSGSVCDTAVSAHTTHCAHAEENMKFRRNCEIILRNSSTTSIRS